MRGAEVAGGPQVGLARAHVVALGGGLFGQRARFHAGIMIRLEGGLEIAGFDLRDDRQQLARDRLRDSRTRPERSGR